MILEKIVFTGIDKFTDLDKLINICENTDIKVEIGFLYSSTKARTSNRYMSLSDIIGKAYILTDYGINTAIHLCGASSINYLRNDMDFTTAVLIREVFDTVQCNNIKVISSDLNIKNTDNLHIPYNKKLVKECYNIVENYPYVSILQDFSGGRGISNNFTLPVMNVQNGFAGGIGPDNITEKLTELNNLLPENYLTWIDMENNIRTRDIFDLNKVKEVIKKTEKYFENV